MGLFSRETEQERHTREMQERAAAEQQAAAAEAEQFASSPVGQAQAARERGDQLLRVEVPIWTVDRGYRWTGQAQEEVVPALQPGELSAVVSQVEASGWTLLSSSSVFIATQGSLNQSEHSGSLVLDGTMVDVLTFRAVPRPVGGPVASA